jgi:Ca2+-binding EF-hand superfamily protein
MMKRDQTQYVTVVASLLCVALLMLPAVAKSAANENKIRTAFNEADLNNDDVLEIDEYVGYIVHLFNSLDKNRDRFLRPDELQVTNEERFRELDRNRDGKISLGEGVGGKVVDFFDADTDRNGVMSFEELLTFEQTKKSTK